MFYDNLLVGTRAFFDISNFDVLPILVLRKVVIKTGAKSVFKTMAKLVAKLPELARG